MREWAIQRYSNASLNTEQVQMKRASDRTYILLVGKRLVAKVLEIFSGFEMALI